MRKSRWWEFIHNLIAHPLMAITFNSKLSNKFHGWTAGKAYQVEVKIESEVEKDEVIVSDSLNQASDVIEKDFIRATQTDEEISSSFFKAMEMFPDER